MLRKRNNQKPRKSAQTFKKIYDCKIKSLIEMIECEVKKNIPQHRRKRE